MSAYVRYLGAEISNSDRHLKPGIRKALDHLSKMNGACQLGLLTGNIERGARIKLGAFSLNDYFSFGAFGDDDEDRNKLLPVARERFEQRVGRTIDFKDCIIVGDTPRDVYCAKPYDAFCVAVATGPYSIDALRQAGADAVFETLADTEAFIKALQY
jgi:phosphoglycolate phosphatase-like HAD superfamily hydrolase